MSDLYQRLYEAECKAHAKTRADANRLRKQLRDVQAESDIFRGQLARQAGWPYRDIFSGGRHTEASIRQRRYYEELDRQIVQLRRQRETPA